MSLCWAASLSPMASSRDASWSPHCSPSSSASCSMRQKRTCQMASTSVSKQTLQPSMFSRTHKNHSSSLSCCLLTTALLPTQRKPNSTSSTSSLMQSRTLASPSARRRLRCCTNPLHKRINGTKLKAVEHFTYLGRVISSDATVSKDLDNRLYKASSSFGRLSKRVWQSHLLLLSRKIQVYRAVIVPTHLYCAETWVLYRMQIRLLLE